MLDLVLRVVRDDVVADRGCPEERADAAAIAERQMLSRVVAADLVVLDVGRAV